MKELKINKENENQRFDKFLFKYFNNAPKSLIYKLLRKKRIKLNLKRADGGEILKSGDIIMLYISPEAMENMKSERKIPKSGCKFDIIYEDSNILIINKPSGILVHSDGKNDNLNDAVLNYLYKKKEYDISEESAFKPAVCNRLDRNTSGIVTFGKNLRSVQALSEMFRNNNADKYYLALVYGEIKKEGFLKGYHIKDNIKNKAEIYDEKVENSAEASLCYRPLKYFEGSTIVEIKLITGRSHQIRAMFSHMGHCIVGDSKYGNQNKDFCRKYNIKAQMLHCHRLIVKKSEALKYIEGKEFLCSFERLEKITGEKL